MGQDARRAAVAESFGEVLGMHRTEPIEIVTVISGHGRDREKLLGPGTSSCSGRPGIPAASRATPRVLSPLPITMR
jgi:hypothetical protein